METAGQSFGGAVKWAAVGVLGAAAVGGLALALFFRQPREALSRGMPPGPASPTPTAAPSQPEATPAASSPAPEPASASQPAPKPAPKPSAPGKLNINTATAAELELLPGIGPALAQRIIDHRVRHGPFGALKDLDGVRGIGPKILERLEPLIVFD